MADDTLTAPNEEWRDAPGWPQYQVSSHGRLRSLHYGKCKTRRQYPDPRTGYMKASLVGAGRKQTVRVHRLVCEAFHGPPPQDRQEVAHSDGRRDNNNYSNLRWASHKENFADQLMHGTYAGPPSRLGHGKLSAKDLKDIAALKAAGQKTADVAARYGVHRRCVNRIYRTGKP